MIFGDGEQTRDFIQVQDVVDLVEIMISKKAAIGNVFNAATGTATTINELAEIIIELFEKDVKADHKEPIAGDIKHSVADISKAEKLGFAPTVSLRKGLEQFLEK